MTSALLRMTSVRFLIIHSFLLFTFSAVLAQDTIPEDLPLIEPQISLHEADVPGMPPKFNVNAELVDDHTRLKFQSADPLNGLYTLQINGDQITLEFSNGHASVPFDITERGGLVFLKTDGYAYKNLKLIHVSAYRDSAPRTRNILLWLSILPPLVAIGMALVFREVIVSLFAGVWVGAFIAGGMRIDSLYYFLLSFWEVADRYIIEALADSGHLAVITFTLFIGGMVAVISRNGGMAGVVLHLSKYATNPTMAQFTTWLLGIAIFFDDYANTLIVGNTMRPVTDRFKISREKLAYLVDSTAAPIAAVAFITTWIGAELGYIESGISMLQGFDQSMSAYSIFLSSLKYSFYPMLTLTFVLLIIGLRRDFGPMLKAEKRARTTGKVSNSEETGSHNAEIEALQPVKDAPLRWQNAALPVLTVILLTIYGLLDTGMSATAESLATEGIDDTGSSWRNIWQAVGQLLPGAEPGFFSKLGIIIGNADSYAALLWASLSGMTLAIILSVSQRILKISDSMETLFTGFKSMMPAIGILVLAWSLAITTGELYTADFLTSLLAGGVSPYAMPVITFVLAATIAFSTGSSWSTMAILYPIVIPTTWILTQTAGMDQDIAMEILFNVIAVVLAASVLGDHCSPISDTTILSSLATDCNHIDHVRTQLPYALLVGSFALACNGLATLLGGSFLVCMLLALAATACMAILIRRLGTPTEQAQNPH